ncbi:hypothetical protein PyrSV_gp30 [Pyrobaculum spherical virus]|uniref:Uncharacterized protein n=1 Tax=Pyrobaculum spherical virus (isolate United States/Yellowstone) TaxID=654907 RepID=Q6ZYH3_PSVY|nr:hypothetical protein PyrSV_gp30 [Pyrobaculum spherical virus]CAG25649.1 hypothetical protein [Pyrobaculum spherical virus]
MRIPIPLIMAAAVAVGAIVTIIIQVNLQVLGSWDDRYAAFNGTHVYQTGPMISTSYKTLYLGFGTATFQNPVSVYYLDKVRSGAGGGNGDLGKYLPVRLMVTSGSLPTNTYLKWTNPLVSTDTRAIYLVSGTSRGYVLGRYYASGAGVWVDVAVPIYYKVSESSVLIYPMEKAAVNPSEGCTVLKNAGSPFTSIYKYVYAVLDGQAYDCSYSSWSSTTVGWTSVASSVTSAALYPSPTYYKVTVNNVDIYLSYWYVVNADPGYFAVKPG